MNDIHNALKTVCEAIEDKKGSGIALLDVSEISSFTNFFVICEGQSTRQNQAICDAIREKMRDELQQFPSHVEGYQSANWILIDFLEFVVHIFSPETRQTYALENLWSDGTRIEPESLTA